jgi:hypothetical protein
MKIVTPEWTVTEFKFSDGNRLQMTDYGNRAIEYLIRDKGMTLEQAILYIAGGPRLMLKEWRS